MTDIISKALSIALSLTLVVFTEAPADAAGARFPDVKFESWYSADVEELALRGLISGCDDGTFRPGRTITAAEFVSIVARCAGAENRPASSGHWASEFMAAGLSGGWYDWD